MENETTKNITFFRFEDLRIYHKSLDYIDWVYNATMLFPDEHSKDLKSSFCASAQSIAMYIAEGSARNKTQFIYYLKMAKSSVRECVILTSISEKQNHLTESMVEESRNQLMEMTKMLGALIGSLQRVNGNYQKNNSKEDIPNGNAYTPTEPIEVRNY